VNGGRNVSKGWYPAPVAGLALVLAAVLAVGEPKVYSITAFGAEASGTRYSTEAIQAAIDAAAASGGGRVVIPAGAFLTRRIDLRSNVILQLDEGATLLGPPSPEEYQGLHYLIHADGAQHFGIVGTGRIDGRASDNVSNAFWDVADRRGMYYDKRPGTEQAGLHLICFRNCRDIELRGFTVANSPAWTIVLEDCQRASVRELTINNSVFGPNTDGIDIVGSSDVAITACRIRTCDDAITLKCPKAGGACRDVTITDCLLVSPSYGLKLGTETAGALERIRCVDCTAQPPDDRGMRGGIGVMSVDGANVEGVTISRMKVAGARAPLFMRLGNRGRRHALSRARLIERYRDRGLRRVGPAPPGLGVRYRRVAGSPHPECDPKEREPRCQWW
jgi:polygalacturonase